MDKLILLTLASFVLGRNECPQKAINIGRGMATRHFNWDKNCTTLDNFYQDVLDNDPTEKCLKRGYWDKAQQLYEKYSVECSPIKCDGLGEKLGKILGVAFCNGDNINITRHVCNALEENKCSNVFFDYAYNNCNDKRVENNYTHYDMYLEYCMK